jgi:hypothetical protein
VSCTTRKPVAQTSNNTVIIRKITSYAGVCCTILLYNFLSDIKKGFFESYQSIVLFLDKVKHPCVQKGESIVSNYPLVDFVEPAASSTSSSLSLTYGRRYHGPLVFPGPGYPKTRIKFRLTEDGTRIYIVDNIEDDVIGEVTSSSSSGLTRVLSTWTGVVLRIFQVQYVNMTLFLLVYQLFLL